MDFQLRRRVRERADDRCEYCGLHQSQSPLATLHIEHIIPKKHGGSNNFDNLALACIDCNLRKGPNIAGFDPQTSMISQLYHPRRHKWEDHFEWQGITIIGKTNIGRATVDVLCLNSEEQLQLRLEILG
ncbi:MAG: HNH endonuclease [Pirellula sp.]